ncbi:MAG TPA: response regulator [Steroidobacteraceae bacterium]|jgi:CheY-like chemotaxis protein
MQANFEPTTDADGLAQLAHDLRNGLAALSSAAHLLDRSIGEPATFQQAREALRGEIDKMRQLIEERLGVGSPIAAIQAARPGDEDRLTVSRRPRGEAPGTDKQGPSRGGRLQKRILVADDNDDAAASLATILRFDGHEVFIAHDGDEALTVAEAAHPDVLLLDIGMPVKDGFEVAREIHSRPWSGGCKLIAVSGWVRAEDKARTEAAGFHGHLSKPLDMDALSRLLTN